MGGSVQAVDDNELRAMLIHTDSLMKTGAWPEFLEACNHALEQMVSLERPDYLH
jgi:hypothetical protein